LKDKTPWKKLIAWLFTSASIGILSRLLMPEPSWKPVVIAIVCSVLLYPLISAYLFKNHTRIFKVSRFVLIGLILFTGYLYYTSWEKRVVTVNEIKRDGNKSGSVKKNVIVGLILKDTTDPDIVQLQNEGKYDEIMEIYQSHNAYDIWTSASIESSMRVLNNSLVLFVVFLSLLGMHTIEAILFQRQRGYQPPEHKVFISYNHENKQEASRLAELLRDNDILVVRDNENMLVGGDINVFIKDSIKTSAVTLLLISEKSLLSGWVATEAVTSYFLADFDESRACIPCYVDDSFLQSGFGNIALKQVNEKLGKIEKEIRERAEMNIDSKDLNEQKTRLYRLRNNMDTILQRLQTSKCVNISGDMLEQNFPEILEAVKNKFSQS
jgi:hypothetical protein